MEPLILYIIIGAAALVVGIVAGKFIFAKTHKNKKRNFRHKPF
jgi:uncharacterized protein YneF (UPF0154 family)